MWPLAFPHAGELVADGSRWGRAVLQVGEEGAGRELLLDAEGETAALGFRPATALKGEGGAPLTLPLVHPVLAIRSTPEGTERTLTARFSPQPVQA